MALPKEADCVDCGGYHPVRWISASEPVCAVCIVNRKIKAKRLGFKRRPSRPLILR
jgi:hypothetical protein